MERFAHSLTGRPEREWELLAAHLRAVGLRAADFAAAFGGRTPAEVMGRLHDIGKRSLAYQGYIRQPAGDATTRGPDHSTAGAREAEILHGKLGRLLAFGIAGHHGGLMDGEGLGKRLGKVLEDYGGWETDAGLLPALDPRDVLPKARNGIDPSFSLAFRARMLFSCLVDADFLETERFYAHAGSQASPERGGTLMQEHLSIIRAHMARHRNTSTPVNQLRSAILDHANSKAALPPGLFTLTVPTGGGKTLTSLSFAAEHALAHGLRRIIYVIPFTEAWIETCGRWKMASSTPVASRAEAWIETATSAVSAGRSVRPCCIFFIGAIRSFSGWRGAVMRHPRWGADLQDGPTPIGRDLG